MAVDLSVDDSKLGWAHLIRNTELLGTWTTVRPSAPVAPAWQAWALSLALGWLISAKAFRLTERLRKWLKPIICAEVERTVPFILAIQTLRRPWLDRVMATFALFVSVEFYTLSLPLLAWAGRELVALHLVVVLVLSIYTGNVLKDTFCAPRPPAVWRSESSVQEKENSLEYGLPSSHTINSISMLLCAFLLCCKEELLGAEDWPYYAMAACFSFLILIVTFGRLYLGFHSPIDLQVGAVIGVTLVILWWHAVPFAEDFLRNGKNVEFFSLALSILLLLAYPTPERPTPSYNDFTYCAGVICGVVCGLRRSLASYSLLAPPVSPFAFLLRLILGLPVILVCKAVVKYAAIKVLPPLCAALNIPIISTSYINHLKPQSIAQGPSEEKVALSSLTTVKSHVTDETQLLMAEPQDASAVKRQRNSFSGIFADGKANVDTAVRFAAYAGLGWGVFQLCPRAFMALGL